MSARRGTQVPTASLVLAAIVLGVVLGVGLEATMKGEKPRLADVAQADERPSRTSGLEGVAPNLMSFADVADEVTPAVVLVKSEKKVKFGSGDQAPD